MGLHSNIKPEKVAATAVTALADKLTLPAYMAKETFDNYKGAEGDTVNVKVEGVLPWHEYTWREDPSTRQDIQFDVYSERKVGVTLGANMYSAVQLIDEQAELDLIGWAKLTDKMTDAVAKGLNTKAANFVADDANYSVKFGIAEDSMYQGFAKLRRILGRLHTPGRENITVLCSGDWETALLMDSRLNLASNVGDDLAKSAAQDASIGKRLGFNFVVDYSLPANTAVAFSSSAFVFANAAPMVPQSAPWGATASKDGVSLRVLRHYNHRKFTDEGVTNSWYGFRTIKDVLGYDNAGQNDVSDYEHQVRAVKLELNGTGAFGGATAAATELKAISGLADADLTVDTTP